MWWWVFPAPGALSSIAANIPAPAFTNQTFCDAQVQLAPGQFYPNVYVPTAAEVSGNVSAFSGLLTNPANNQAFPNGTIPSSQLTTLFAWRIGPAQVTSVGGGWSPTGSLTEIMFTEAAALLPSGHVLVVGTADGSADIYDPATGIFSLAGKMQTVHGGFLTATLLSDGRVFVEGGTGAPSSAELYDPVSGQFAATGNLAQPHGYGQTATLLQDGRVLVVGGLAAAGGGGSTKTFPITTRASPMSRNQFFTSRSRHRRSRSPNRPRRFPWAASRNRSTLRSTPASVCEIVSPSNNRWPVSISHSTTPNDQISDRLSIGLPAACSGDMYAAVPIIMPACVARVVRVGELAGLPLSGV